MSAPFSSMRPLFVCLFILFNLEGFSYAHRTPLYDTRIYLYTFFIVCLSLCFFLCFVVYALLMCRGGEFSGGHRRRGWCC